MKRTSFALGMFSLVGFLAMSCAETPTEQITAGSAEEYNGPVTQKILIQNADGTQTESYLRNVYPSVAEAVSNPEPYLTRALGHPNDRMLGHPNGTVYDLAKDTGSRKVDCRSLYDIRGEFQGCGGTALECMCQAIVVHPTN